MEKIRFEYKDMPQGYRAVSFNTPLAYFATKVRQGKNGPEAFLEEMTVKDCRHIDGCVYFMKGRVPDAVICKNIELYQKIKDTARWKQNDITKDN